MAASIVVLYWSVMRWTLEKFLQSAYHWHWYIAVAVILCAARGNTQRLSLSDNNLATALLGICGAVEALNQFSLQIQLLSAVLFILAIHALSGYLIDNELWRSRQWPVVVGVALLPLDFYLEPYFGYPLRLLTANVAEWMLRLAGYDAVSGQSILLVESRASVVDLDCSGINSLWAGTVFFLLLSWLTRLWVNLRWWCLWGLLLLLLLFSNVVRIFTLVLLDNKGLHGLAEIAHTSMSALGFTMAILLVWKLTHRHKKQRLAPSCSLADPKYLSLHWPCLPVTVLLLGISAIPSANKQYQFTHNSIELPQVLAAIEIELREEESDFFEISGALATKYQLGATTNHDSVVLVTSNWWKAQHKPDHCLQAMGLSIQDSRLLTLNQAQVSIRTVSVLRLVDVDNRLYTAVYWFQAKDDSTADHYHRMVDTFLHPNRQWTMVSLLLEGDVGISKVTNLVLPISLAIDYSYRDEI